MDDSQLVKNAQNRYLYGTFLDASEAFNKGLMQASKGQPLQTSDPVGVVKNNYEQQLETYLNKLPQDVDLTQVPDKYRNNIANFLSVQKSKYVDLANQVNDYEVGSEMYMSLSNQMNNIRNSFENLSTQMKNYGANKKEIIDNIRNQSTSLSPENQVNVNLLRSVYTEEFDLNIDEYGNVGFIGDDGMVSMNDLPGYELKDFGAAKGIMSAAENVYKNGIVLKQGDVMYNKYRNDLKIGIDKGGRNTLMSLVYDDLIGDTRLADDPYIAQNIEAYRNGNMTFEALRDVVVDNYMGVLVDHSTSGYKAKQVAASKRRGQYGRTSSGLGRQIGSGFFVKTNEKGQIVETDIWAKTVTVRDPNTFEIISTTGKPTEENSGKTSYDPFDFNKKPDADFRVDQSPNAK